MKAYWGSGGISPCILNFGTTWRWVVSFMPQPIYPQGKSPWYPLDRRLGGASEQAWTWWWGEKFPTLPGQQSPIIQPLSSVVYSVISFTAIHLYLQSYECHGKWGKVAKDTSENYMYSKGNRELPGALTGDQGLSTLGMGHRESWVGGAKEWKRAGVHVCVCVCIVKFAKQDAPVEVAFYIGGGLLVNICKSHDSSVGIAIRLWAGGLGF
jgi:hypothetical protein